MEYLKKMEYHSKKKILGNMLTETGDAGSSPHVAKEFFRIILTKYC